MFSIFIWYLFVAFFLRRPTALWLYNMKQQYHHSRMVQPLFIYILGVKVESLEAKYRYCSKILFSLSIFGTALRS